MEYSKKFVKDIFKSAPDEIADLVSSDEVLDLVVEIAQQNHLNQQQENLLSKELMLLILGLRTKDTFIDAIKEKLTLDREGATKIAISIKNRILIKLPENALLAQSEYAQTKVAEAGAAAFDMPTNDIEIPSVILPEVVPGEEAHDSPVGSKAEIPASTEPANVSGATSQAPLAENKPLEPAAPTVETEKKSGYPGGIDPYREPIE